MMTSTLSPQFIQELCSDELFVRKVQTILSKSSNVGHRTLSIQLSQNEDQNIECQTRHKQNQNISLHKDISPKKQNRIDQRGERKIQIDSIVDQISHTILEIVFQQTNQAYSENIRMANQIDKLREAVEKITVGSEIKLRQSSKEKQKTGADTSMFFQNGLDSSLEIKNLRKPTNSDKLGSLSFINSFINENAVSSDQISQKINASISKVQSNIEDRILTMEKEFTRRIQQIMKTIKHLVHSMSEQENQQSFKKRNPNNNKSKEQITQFCPLKEHKMQSPQSSQISKKSNKQSPLIDVKERVFLSTNTPQKKPSQDVRSLLDKSQNRISSFFGLGGSGKGKNR